MKTFILIFGRIHLDEPAQSLKTDLFPGKVVYSEIYYYSEIYCYQCGYLLVFGRKQSTEHLTFA